MSSICINAEAGDDFMRRPPVKNWESSHQQNVLELAHPVADAAVKAAEEVRVNFIIILDICRYAQQR